MNKIITFLTFNGNCREAMSFYRDCLGGDLVLQSVGDSPQSAGLPKAMKDYIVHASLRKGNMLLMGTDMIDENLSRGNSVSILLECNSDSELRLYYKKLVASGVPTQPVAKNYWGALGGGLTDKFGIQWLLHYKKQAMPRITSETQEQ